MSNKILLNNCALDLQRAAQWYYLNPKGKTHQIFLKHARKILSQGCFPQKEKILKELLKIEKELTICPKRNINLADKILTLGCLLKR